MFKALHGQAPHCLTDDCQLVAAAGRRQLWSSDAVTCLVPRTRTCLGDLSFGVAGSASISLTLRGDPADLLVGALAVPAGAGQRRRALRALHALCALFSMTLLHLYPSQRKHAYHYIV